LREVISARARVDSVCLTFEVGINCTDDNAGMCRLGLMKPDEVFAIEREHVTALRLCVFEHFFIRDFEIGSSSIKRS